MKNAKEIIMKLAQKESNNAEDKLNYNGNQKEFIKSIENHDDISLNSIQISSNSHQANNNHLEIDLTLTESEDEQEETMPKICRYYMRKEWKFGKTENLIILSNMTCSRKMEWQNSFKKIFVIYGADL